MRSWHEVQASSRRLGRALTHWARPGVRHLRCIAIVCNALVLPSARAETPRVQAVNVVPLTMHTPRHGFNRMVISIDLCAPGTTRCVTIDEVMVDTGSTGLRIEPGVLPSSLGLRPMLGEGAAPLGECVRFVHDQAWGFLARADLHLGGMVAPNLPIQLISPDDEPHPSQCPASNVSPTSNATLGIGPLTDCPDPCDGSGPGASYFACPPDGCRPIRMEAADRLPNPVWRLPRHNSGVVFELPGVPPEGSGGVTGRLIFGIDTADNNRIDAMHVLRLDAFGRFTSVMAGRPYPHSSIDSGTTTMVVPADDFRRCERIPWALCASPVRRVEAEMVGADGGRIGASFRVGDFAALTRPGIGAVDGVAVAAPAAARGLVWGAPLFLGKRVAFGFETPVGGGAFYGFRDQP